MYYHLKEGMCVYIELLSRKKKFNPIYHMPYSTVQYDVKVHVNYNTESIIEYCISFYIWWLY